MSLACQSKEDEKMHRRSFNIFGERPLLYYLKENDRKIRSRIEQEQEDYILNVNETEYVNYLINEFTIIQTYAIPTPQIRKNIAVKPEVAATGYKPEPTLDQSIYHDILKTIGFAGKTFERLPSTYSGKSEENLRDHLLWYLGSHYEGSATGETFNKTGKTDILIRYENQNVFIAECKFWQGQQHYLAAITQLLGYLTWRDSKAAVVVFVKNEDFSSVLQTVEEVTPDHPNYLGFVDKEDESWFNYRFHIDGDPNREVKLAVLLFHIPS